jgi:hypothetical protein
MLVAQIAYDHLTPPARTAMDASIARFNQKKINDRKELDTAYDPVTAACWMDDIRSLKGLYNFDVWHYVNLPFTPDGLPAPDGNVQPNVIWAIEKCVPLVTGQTTDAAIDRDQALVMLLHLVGDIHQPLHTTSRGEDAGGNKVKLANLKDPLADLVFSKGGNLHFFWDSAYRRIYKDGSATVLYEAPLLNDRGRPVAGHKAVAEMIRREATALESKYPPSHFQAQADPPTWAKESHALGYSLGYGKLPATTGNRPVKLTEDYVTAARDCAQERVVLAGYRLANLLNLLLTTPSAPTASPAPSAPPTAATPATPLTTPDATSMPAGDSKPPKLILTTPATENPAQ